MKNVQGALEKLLLEAKLPEGYEPWLTDDEKAIVIAPIIERALRAAAMEMGDRAGFYWKGHEGLLDECVTAGVEAMVEKSCRHYRRV